MALGGSDIGATEQAYFAADKPVVLGYNLLKDAISSGTVSWYTTTSSGGTPGGTDETDADYPEARMADDYTDAQSRPANAGANRDIRIDFGAEVTFDSIVMVNVDNEVGTFEVYTGDDASYTNMVQINVSTSLTGTRNRHAFWEFDYNGAGSSGPERITAQYLVLRFLSGGPSVKVSIGDLWIGRRYQLTHQPNLPWGNNNLAGEVSEFISSSGKRTRYIRHYGKRVMQGVVSVADSDSADMDAWLALASEGAGPFIWCDEPTTSPHQFYLMYMNAPVVQRSLVGYSERQYVIDATEQGPDFYALE